MENLKAVNLYDYNQTIAKDLFESVTYPWEALPKIKDFILELGKTLDLDKFDKIGDDIWVAKTAKVSPTAFLAGPLIICDNAEKVETGVKKFGAMIGDNVEVGCNSVLNPGTVIGRNTNVYPLSMVRGYVPENSIYKKQGEVAEKR